MTNSDEFVLTVQDIYNAFHEHMSKLDELWPDSHPHGPAKVNIVELIDAIKLRLISRAEKNLSRYESPFEKAAKKVTGSAAKSYQGPSKDAKTEVPVKTDMQTAFEEAKSRMRRSPS